MMRSRMALSMFVLITTSASASAELSEMDRQHLVAHLEMTGSWLIDEVSNLSPAQLEFRSAPGTWSILDVIEHLVVVGPIYWNDLQNAIKTPARDLGLADRDAGILWYGIDRTHRESALASETPPGRLRDINAGLAEYRKLHARLLDFAKRTRDDLRRHFVERQRCDAYQWALLISTHEQRHILQIREIKGHTRFPER